VFDIAHLLSQGHLAVLAGKQIAHIN